MAEYQNPSWSHVTSDFKENRSRIDLLVREFVKESKVDFIEQSGGGRVSIALVNRDGRGVIDNPWGMRVFRLTDVPLDGEALKEVLRSVQMRHDAKKIVVLMENADVRSISLGAQNESEIPHIHINFPNRHFGCSWSFVTPVADYPLKDFVDSLDVSYAENEVRVVDDKWAAWRYCAM